MSRTMAFARKNFPLLRLFLSDAFDGLKVLHTLWRQLYSFAYFDCARNVAWLELANFEAREKILRACPRPKLEN